MTVFMFVYMHSYVYFVFIYMNAFENACLNFATVSILVFDLSCANDSSSLSLCLLDCQVGSKNVNFLLQIASWLGWDKEAIYN